MKSHRGKIGSGQTARTTRTGHGGVIGRLLETHPETAPESPSPSTSATSDLPSPEDVLAMSYEEFRRADLALLVRSAVLGEDVIIASAEGAAEKVRGDQVVYLITEFRHLFGSGELNLDALRLLHRLKRAFPEARMTGARGADWRTDDGPRE